MRKYNLIILVALLCIGMIACKSEKGSSTEDLNVPQEFKLPDWAKAATIYEANTRHMSADGDFKSLEKQVPRLKAMGVDIVWLMPIHPISVLKRKATGDLLVKDLKDPEERKKYLGSPYAVQDYRGINPDFGSAQDFRNLVASLHKKNMRLIIDWVPNHTGWDHQWIVDHPDWYTKNKEGAITDPMNPGTGESWGWTDVADLNYDNMDMRKAMLDEMKYWLTEYDIDGFRVDVAHGITQEFWDVVAPALTATKSDIFLLAEAEVESHRNNKTFHTSYGWSLYHILNDIAKGNANAMDIDKWYVADRKKFSAGFHMHFTSNHDENAWAGPAITRMGEGHLTLAALAASFDGMPLIYSGMEEPINRKLAFFTKDHIDFKDLAYAEFYTKLFKLKHDNAALWNGGHGGALVKLVEHETVYAFKRTKGKQSVVGIFNLSNERQSITLPEGIRGSDVMTGQDIIWKEETALGLEPWQYYLISSN